MTEMKTFLSKIQQLENKIKSLKGETGEVEEEEELKEEFQFTDNTSSCSVLESESIYIGLEPSQPEGPLSGKSLINYKILVFIYQDKFNN